MDILNCNWIILDRSKTGLIVLKADENTDEAYVLGVGWFRNKFATNLKDKARDQLVEKGKI